MVNDQQNFGLGELGQRVQAMSDPLPEPRLRPYQGGSAPVVPAPAVPVPHDRTTPPAAPPATSSAFTSWPSSYTASPIPAAPEPYPSPAAPTTNGYAHGTASTASAAPSTPPAPAAAQLPASSPADDSNAPKSGLQRAIDAVRSTLPLVQRLLPLLDGNFATAITALVAPQAVHHPPPPPVRVDLEPVERGLAEVRTSHRELRTQVQEHSTSLKRVEDQLERVREATDRNTLEQQELVEDLRTAGNRISTFAIIGLVLLVVSLGFNIFLLIQLQHILR